MGGVGDGGPGGLSETWVGRGGAAIFLRGMLKAYGERNRSVVAADSFRGVPEPDPIAYPADQDSVLHTAGSLAVSLEEVKENFRLYDLLDDFLELNAIPFGPLFLRKMGLHPEEVLGGGSGDHKLQRVRELIQRFPTLRWVLLGDSGQRDAETYSTIAQEFGDRILAIYIRDVDSAPDTQRDQTVDGFIKKIAGTHVPMLLVADSIAIAEHAQSLGLIDAAAIPGIANEVDQDAQRPTLGKATADSVKGDVADAVKTATGTKPPR